MTMLQSLIEAEKLLRPLVKLAEDYKTQRGAKAGTLLSKVRNSHLRCQEAIATIQGVTAEASKLTVNPLEALTTTKPSSK